jgi:Zn-dependent metalloprotease
LPKLYLREGHTLSDPSSLKSSEIAKEFLRAQSEVFSLSSAEIDRLRLTVDDSTDNAKFLAFNQTLNGIDVFNGHIKFTLNKAGEVIQISTRYVVPGVDIPTTPRLTPEEAVKAAFAGISLKIPSALSTGPAMEGRTTFLNPQGKNYSAVTTELSIFPTTASSARLAYRIFLEVDAKSWYEILIDANNGSVLYRHNLYVFSGQANVWTQSPMIGTRTLFSFPDPSSMDPAGWMPSDGTVTTGNNVDAYLDANGNDAADQVTTGTMNNGRAFSANQVFDFPFGDVTVRLDPRLYQAAAITNIFYYANIAHDYYYSLGFNEAAGNFQTDNFGKGGVGNDAVLAEAQYGLFTNNAAFGPTPEGIAPKIRMGLFTMGTSSRTDDADSDYDGMVVLHEYGHGVSNRLVGAKTSTSCLTKIQSGALGEGWSDYFASSYFNNPVQGAYIGQNPTRGVRRFSYEGYPLTYEDIGNQGYEVHNDGEIWAGTLWDLRKSLGAAVTDKLVIDGLKATPCNPSMTDARDAIVSADVADNNGSNRISIWTVFAKHGMGYSAVGVDGTILTGTRYDAAYDLPPDLQANPNPKITSNPLLLRLGSGDAYSYTIAASNPAAGTLNYAMTQGPTGMTVDAASGAVNWTATFVSQRVKITVTDGKGGKVVHGYRLPVLTTLTNGAPISITGDLSSAGYAMISVPSATPVLQVKLRSGTGDADLAVISPIGTVAQSIRDGNTETLSFANPLAGIWQVVVVGFQSYASVSLSAALITPTTISANSSFSGLSGDFTSETFYRVTIPAGIAAFNISTSGGTGDVDLLWRKGFPAVCQPGVEAFAPCQFDDSSANDGTAEAASIPNPAPGDWYLDLVGFLAYSDVRLDVSATYPVLTLTATGAATTSTTGTGANVATGYATATVGSGTAPFGTAVFSYTQNGYVVSEAGVPASSPVSIARIFIEYRTGVTAGIGTIDTYTGVAIANPAASQVSVTYTLRDQSGQTLTTGHGTMPAGTHRAKFIHEFRDLAPDFNLPANFSTAILYGSLEIASTGPLSVLGLRLTTNQRGETLLTSTAVADVSKPASNSPVYFPQLADGGGYTTSIILSNTTGATETGTLAIFDNDGNALSVQAVGGSVASTFSYSIPASGTFVFRTDGSPADAHAGWVKVTPSAGNNAPIGAGVFSFSPAGILVTESGIPSAVPATRARLYIDKSKGHDTGLALGNPNGAPITVTVQALQTNGASAGSGPATINLVPNGHASAFIGQLINGLPDGFTGIADLTSSSPFVPLNLRSLTNGRGDFLLTTFPAPDVTQPAPTPIIFPQIADGAGYATQFIFISANGAASVTVNFVGDDGQPLAVGRNP